MITTRITTIIRWAAIAALALGISTSWAQGESHQGVVLETMNGGGYTYVQIQEGEATLWAAGPQIELKKGDTVAVQEQMTMNNFTSKTLNRTFNKLMFVGSIDKK